MKKLKIPYFIFLVGSICSCETDDITDDNNSTIVINEQVCPEEHDACQDGKTCYVQAHDDQIDDFPDP